MRNEIQFSAEHCNFGSISFQMLTEVLRARSLSILDALQVKAVDFAQIKRFAAHMSLAADDLINISGLTSRKDERSQTPFPYNPAESEPTSLNSVLELSRIASEQRLKERTKQLTLDSPLREHYISGNPWEVAWVIFLIINRTSGSANTIDSSRNGSHMHVSVVEKDHVVDVSVQSLRPLTPATPRQTSDSDQPLLSDLEWYCLNGLMKKNELYLIQTAINSGAGEFSHSITLRIPTFRPGFEL